MIKRTDFLFIVGVSARLRPTVQRVYVSSTARRLNQQLNIKFRNQSESKNSYKPRTNNRESPETEKQLSQSNLQAITVYNKIHNS